MTRVQQEGALNCSRCSSMKRHCGNSMGRGSQVHPPRLPMPSAWDATTLRRIYAHVKSTIMKQTGLSSIAGTWKDLAIEFIFSVPTTWRSLETINCFKMTIASAGFGCEGRRHTATVELTEAGSRSGGYYQAAKCGFQEGRRVLIGRCGRWHYRLCAHESC